MAYGHPGAAEGACQGTSRWERDGCQPNEGQYYADYQQTDLLPAKRRIPEPQRMGEYRDEGGHYPDKDQKQWGFGF